MYRLFSEFKWGETSLQLRLLMTVYIFSYMDNFFLMCFTIEFLVKAIAWRLYGTWFDSLTHQEVIGYFSDGWNVLDFSILVSGYVSYIFPNMTSARLLRIIRPLRSVSHFSGTRQLVDTITRSLSGLFHSLVSSMYTRI